MIINFYAEDRKLLEALFIIFQRITVSRLKIKFSAETISLPEKWKGGGNYAEVRMAALPSKAVQFTNLAHQGPHT